MQKLGGLILSSQLDELHKLPSWIEAISQAHALSARLQFKLDLVLNEAIPNIMCYGFEDTAVHEIVISLYQTDTACKLEIVDDGIAFNPLTRPYMPPAQSLESAEIGGLGIDLIKKMSDRQSYARIDHRNVFCLFFARD